MASLAAVEAAAEVEAVSDSSAKKVVNNMKV